MLYQLYFVVFLCQWTQPFSPRSFISMLIFLTLSTQNKLFSNEYIPLISRMRVPYGKLWTEFFPSFHGPSAKRAGHENKEVRKRGSTTCSRTKQTRLIRCLLYGFVDYSGKITKLFDVVTCDREMEVCIIRLLTNLKLTNHSTRNQSAI